MDITKISKFAFFPQISSKKSKESSERDAQQGGDPTSYQQEKDVSHEEAKTAAKKLEESDHFRQNKLSIEVREFDNKYFLDVFDPSKKKIKTIGNIGIRAILRSYSSSDHNLKAHILDKRV